MTRRGWWLGILGGAVLGAAVAAGPAGADWVSPVDLAPASPAGHSVGAPSIAVARDGTAFAAFVRFDGTDRAVVATRSPGGAFGAVRDLSNVGDTVSSPVVAVDRQGDATVAWADFTPPTAVEVRFRPAGGDWGATSRIDVGGAVNQLVLAVGDNGAAVVAW